MTVDPRRNAMESFLAASDWKDATVSLLAGDASNRRYFRTDSDARTTAIVMDAPPEKGEDVRPFIRIATHLNNLGLSAPQIYDADEARGFLIIEDLGDDLFARLLERDPSMEPELYGAATDTLVNLADTEIPRGIESYDAETMPPLAGLAATWYAGDQSLSSPLAAATHQALKLLPQARKTLVLRDYHAENLIWLPDRKGAARVGLLDFQGARNGHPAYDLASLIRDARRDVSQRTKPLMTMRLAHGLGWNRDEADFAVSTQGAQRNLRILGVFARLSLHFGKSNYIDLIPRVWSNLMEELSHPELSTLRDQVTSMLPPPTSDILKDLKARCGTIPTLA